MTRHIRSLVLAATLATLTACGSTPRSNFYDLSVVATPAAEGSSVSVQVGPVTIPSSVDRPQFVISAGPNQYTLDEYNRWASPLDEAITDALVGDLSALLGSPSVTNSTSGIGNASYRVGVQVQRFESRLDSSVSFEAAWVVKRLADDSVVSGRTVVQQPAPNGYPDLAIAYSQAVGRLASEVAAAVRQLDATPVSKK